MERSIFFEGGVPVRLQQHDREERVAELTVHLLQSASGAGRTASLRFQLSDEADPFFYYWTEIDEESFQALKNEQCIMVDFSTFPSKVVEMLEASKSSSFECRLIVTASSSRFEIVETNAFKKIVHLSLNVAHGDDAEVKKYLADKWTLTKTSLLHLTQQHEQLADNSSIQIQQLVELGEQRDARIRKLEESLSLAQSQGENSAVAAKRAGLDELAAAQKSWALERSQIESEHSARVTRLETELSAARLECDKKGSSIVQLSGECRELKLRCESLESSEKASLADLAIARKRHLEADASLHDALLRNHEMEVAIGRLESANQEKEVVTKQQMQLVEAAKAQAQQSLHESESLRISNTKLEEKLRTATSEITKGNHIIEQLQTEVRTVRARNKERGAINKSLEERAAQRDTEVARLVEQMSSLKMQLASKENEVSGLQAQLIESRGHVAQLGKELEASKATFEFVHQQLEESRSRHVGSYTASSVPASTSMRAALDSMSRSDLASMQSTPINGPLYRAQAALSTAASPASFGSHHQNVANSQTPSRQATFKAPGDMSGAKHSFGQPTVA